MILWLRFFFGGRCRIFHPFSFASFSFAELLKSFFVLQIAFLFLFNQLFTSTTCLSRGS